MSFVEPRDFGSYAKALRKSAQKVSASDGPMPSPTIFVGAVLMEQNDDWQTQNRYMQIEGFAEPADKIADLKPLQITPKAA